MKRRPSPRPNAEGYPGRDVRPRLPMRQIGIIPSLQIMIGAGLLYKARQSPASSAKPLTSDSTMEVVSVGSTPSDTRVTAPPMTPVLELTNTPAGVSTPALLPERQLNRLLEAGKPVLLLFHSNTCAECIKMREIVPEVDPDLSASVAPLGANVSDGRSKSLLQRVNIHAIPALIPVDPQGGVGEQLRVMAPDALREQARTASLVIG